MQHAPTTASETTVTDFIQTANSLIESEEDLSTDPRINKCFNAYLYVHPKKSEGLNILFEMLLKSRLRDLQLAAISTPESLNAQTNSWIYAGTDTNLVLDFRKKWFEAHPEDFATYQKRFGAYNPLSIAAETHKAEPIQSVLSSLSQDDIAQLINGKDLSCRTPLSYVFGEGWLDKNTAEHVLAVEALTTAGATPENEDSKHSSLSYLLHERNAADFNQHTCKLVELLATPDNVNQKNIRDKTPLIQIAQELARTTIVKLTEPADYKRGGIWVARVIEHLLAKGAAPSIHDGYLTPLHYLAGWSRTELQADLYSRLIPLLIKAGADTNADIPSGKHDSFQELRLQKTLAPFKATPLHYLFKYSDSDEANQHTLFLLQQLCRGITPQSLNAQDHDNSKTVLHYLAQTVPNEYSLPLFQELLSQGADPRIPSGLNQSGDDAIQIAQLNGFDPTVIDALTVAATTLNEDDAAELSGRLADQSEGLAHLSLLSSGDAEQKRGVSTAPTVSEASTPYSQSAP